MAPTAAAPRRTLRRLMPRVPSGPDRVKRAIVGSCDFFVRLRLRCAVRGLCQRPDDNAPGEADLEGVVAETLGLVQNDVGRASESVVSGGLSVQGCFGFWIPPRFMGN